MDDYYDILNVKKGSSKDEIKKASAYKSLWELRESNKKSFDGIDPIKINSNFEEMAEEYYLDKYKISLSNPKKITEKLYDNKSFESYFLGCNIEFNAINDIHAFGFMNEFISNSKGILFIEDFEITKRKDYLAKDFVVISKGGFNAFAVSVTAKIKWLFFKKKLV